MNIDNPYNLNLESTESQTVSENRADEEVLKETFKELRLRRIQSRFSENVIVCAGEACCCKLLSEGHRTACGAFRKGRIHEKAGFMGPVPGFTAAVLFRLRQKA